MRSNSPAFECTADCTQDVSAGTQVHLAAVADSTSRFGAWGGACASSTAGCDLTVSADTDVTARFDGVGPLPQGEISMAVVVNGQGTITSRPAGIDCGQTCHATFTTTVDLIPSPQAGWRFDGWGGGCTGPGPCHLSPPGGAGLAVTVFATFVPLTPPPTADCAGIVPENLGTPISVTLVGKSCENATSDGAGNVAADASGHWFVFSPAGAPLGDYVAQGAIPQGKGFQGLEPRGTGSIQALVMRAPAGTVSAETGVGGTVPQVGRVSGGGSVVVSPVCGGTPPGAIEIDRFDVTGKLSTRGSILGGCNGGLVTGVGDAGGSTFVLLSGGKNVGLSSEVVGRWVDAGGRPQTDFFAVASSPPKQALVRALVGGGVAIQLDGVWVGTVNGGTAAVQEPPGWLTDNPDDDFTIVRDRRAYAVLPRGAADPRTMTLYSAQGNRCGTSIFPVGGLTTGADGTAIGASGAGGCTKTWWPGLLR